MEEREERREKKGKGNEEVGLKPFLPDLLLSSHTKMASVLSSRDGNLMERDGSLPQYSI